MTASPIGWLNLESLQSMHRSVVATYELPLLFLMDCSDSKLGHPMGLAVIGQANLDALMEAMAGGSRLGAVPAVLAARKWETMWECLAGTFPYLEGDLRNPPRRDECHVMIVARGDAGLVVLPVATNVEQ